MASENGSTHKRGAHFAGAERPSRPATVPDAAPAPAATPYASPEPQPSEVAPLVDDEAPQPVSAGSAGAFDTIAPGQGAVVTTRDTAAQAADAAHENFRETGAAKRLTGSNRPCYQEQDRGSHVNPRTIAIFVGIALVIVVAAVLITQHLLNSGTDDTGGSTLVEDQQVDITGTIDYGGYQYQLAQQDDGSYALTRVSTGGSSDSLVLATLDGTPITLILNNGALLVPENISGGWDVVVYTIGDGSVVSKLSNSDGSDVTGTSTLASAQVSDGSLVLTDSDGLSTTVPLS